MANDGDPTDVSIPIRIEVCVNFVDAFLLCDCFLIETNTFFVVC